MFVNFFYTGALKIILLRGFLSEVDFRWGYFWFAFMFRSLKGYSIWAKRLIKTPLRAFDVYKSYVGPKRYGKIIWLECRIYYFPGEYYT